MEIQEVIDKIYHCIDLEKETVEDTKLDHGIRTYRIQKLEQVIQFEVNRLGHLLTKQYYDYLPSKFLLFKQKITAQIVSSTIVIFLPRDTVLHSSDMYYDNVYRPLLKYLETMGLDTRVYFENKIIIQVKRRNYGD